MEPYGDNFIPVIPIDYQQHSDERPFCWDQTCPCHDDEEVILETSQAVEDGLMTPEEATDFVNGRMV
jgi:hypothetical protein